MECGLMDTSSGWIHPWDWAKKFKLCFHCLSEDHLGQYCIWTRVCGQNGCKEVQHQFLHKVPQSLSQTNDTRPNTFKQIDKVDNNEKDIFRGEDLHKG